ncbi:MAG: hypothetical protein ACXQS8_05625 [Candidatus Helarchaeales archaeon]
MKELLKIRYDLRPLKEDPRKNVDELRSLKDFIEIIQECYLPEKIEGPLPFDLKKVLSVALVGNFATGELKDEARQEIIKETRFRIWDGEELRFFSTEVTRKYKYWWHLFDTDDRLYTRAGTIHPWTFIWLLMQQPAIISYLYSRIQAFRKRMRHEHFLAISNPVALFPASMTRIYFTPLDLIFFHKLSEYFPKTYHESIAHYKSPHPLFNAEKVNNLLENIAREVNTSFEGDTRIENLKTRLKRIQQYFGVMYFYYIPMQVIDRVPILIEFEEPNVISENFHVNLPHFVSGENNEININVARKHLNSVLKKFREHGKIVDAYQGTYIIFPMHSLEMFDPAMQQWKFKPELLHGAFKEAETIIDYSHRDIQFPQIEPSPLLDQDYINMYFYRTNFFQMGPDVRLRKDLGISTRKFYNIEDDLKKRAPYGFVMFILRFGTLESASMHVEGNQEWYFDFFQQVTKFLPTRLFILAKGRNKTRITCFFHAPVGMVLKFGKLYKNYFADYYPEFHFRFDDNPQLQNAGILPSRKWDSDINYWKDDYQIKF